MRGNDILITTIRILQCALTCTIISGYIVGILSSIVLELSFAKFYFLGTGFIYYLMALGKSPGSLLGIDETSSVKGICNECNRIRGYRTKHCRICNKCYYSRDHHCVLLGKCVATNNIQEFFYSLLFSSVYFFVQFLTGTWKPLALFLCMTLMCGTVWFGAVIVSKKSSVELLEMERWKLNPKEIRNLSATVQTDLLYILFPFLRISTIVEY